jgi:hypothetical protein
MHNSTECCDLGYSTDCHFAKCCSTESRDTLKNKNVFKVLNKSGKEFAKVLDQWVP